MNITGKSFQLVIKKRFRHNKCIVSRYSWSLGKDNRVIKFGHIKVKFTAKDVSGHTIVLSTYISKC